jgi:hypothetical protein
VTAARSFERLSRWSFERKRGRLSRDFLHTDAGALWTEDTPHQLAIFITTVDLDETTRRLRTLPALVLVSSDIGQRNSSTVERLVARGWTYAEPPVRISPVHAHSVSSYPPPPADRDPLVVTPCVPPDAAYLDRFADPPRTTEQW